MRKRPFLAIALMAAATLTFSGCAANSSGSSAEDGTVRIVASTNVYGDIAKTIAGDAVEVTSIITSVAQDPHSYEANARDRLAVSKADILIENGGGYDDYMESLRKGEGPSDLIVLNAVDISGLDHDHSDDSSSTADPSSTDAAGHDHDHDHGEFNEHVWYDFHAMGALADSLADALTKVDPSRASTFEQNAAAFARDLDELEARTAAIAQQRAGEAVAITEPVPLYLFEEMGLKNATPDEFSEAIEAGNDVSPVVLKQTLDLVSGRHVVMLAYNEQTSGSETEKVLAAAKEAGVPVVHFTETLPSGKDYIGWMNANIDAVAKALGE